MPRHRRCHLPQRIGENIRQHQIERRAAANCGAENPVARIACTRSPETLSRRFRARPAPRADRYRSPAPFVQRLRGGDRQHAGAGAEIEHAARPPRLQHLIEQQQAAARGAVMAGAERQRRLDFDADLVGRHVARSCWPCTTKRPAGTGTRSSRLALTQSLASTVRNDALARFPSPAARPRVRAPAPVRRLGEMHRDVPAAVRPLERGDRGLAFKKTSVRDRQHAWRCCSSPIAKLARWVEGWKSLKNLEKSGEATRRGASFKFEQISCRDYPEKFTPSSLEPP